MPHICIAIVAYRSDDTLPRCLAALDAQTERDFEIVIVDNGLTPSLDSIIARVASPVKIIRSGGNIGFAAGNNRAAEAAAPDTVWFAALNPDAYALPSWLAAFRHAATAYPDCNMFGSLQLEASDPSYCDGMGDCFHASGLVWRRGHGWEIPDEIKDEEVFSPCGAAAFYRFADFRVAGGFDEDFFCYNEDVDLAFRLRLRGGNCMQLAGAVVHHVGGASGVSSFAVYHGIRNLIWTFIKNMPQPLLALLLPVHILAVGMLVLRNIVLGRGADAKRALRDAIVGRDKILAKRQTIQSTRTAKLTDLARSISWSPLGPLTHVLRPHGRRHKEK